MQLEDGQVKLLGEWVMEECMGEAEPPEDEGPDERDVRLRRERKVVMKKTRVVRYGGERVEPPVSRG